ncbi:MAG: hypothetical protein BJ554DRAFT_2565 [Olpidium bornovanus]|uniref:CDP-diacylglycerol--glycerol-3-phosphate 3-phosphatidyltransferase n=1 Tax=Olpidium bornovanus TaxID=278681 RepID=A0A8H8A124_9FUNG|nr:MAG: hypothetical protein BJ554DRAFT_2565 [Olpidium bornovanus]
MAAVLELLPGRVRPFPALLLPKTPPRAAARVWWWLADSPAAAARLLFCFAGRFGSRMPRPLLLPPPRPFPARRTFHSRGFAAGLSPDPTERAPTAPTESRAHGRPPARAAAASATLRGLVPPVRGLVDISPVFAVRADDVQLEGSPWVPAELPFRNRAQSRGAGHGLGLTGFLFPSTQAAIRNARRRVVLAALYIGHGETDLVRRTPDSARQLPARISAIRAALEANRASKTAPRLEVTVLVDCLRGTRGGASSTASLLLPLTNEFPESLKVLMYHTPDLHGLLKKICPARFNEAVGLQHIKAYISDDDVMLTGFVERLSSDYFTDLVHTVGDFSYTLRTFSSSPLSSYHIRAMTSPDPVENRQQFRTEVTARMEAFQARWLAHTRELRDSLLALDPSLPQVDTLVFPSVQMGPFGIRQDEKATSHLIRAVNKACHDEGEEDLGRRWRLHVTTGYFNLAPKYIDLLLPDVSGALVNLLAAAPEVGCG